MTSIMDEADRAQVLRHAVLVAFMRGLGALLGLVFWVYLGRRIGASGSGLIREGLALVMFAAALVRFGLDNVVLREVAVLTCGGQVESPAARGLLGRVVLLILAVGLPVAGCLWLGADALSEHWFHDPGLAAVLAITGWACVPLAIIAVTGEAHKGAGRAVWGTFLIFDARHIAFLAGAALWLGLPDGTGLTGSAATERTAWILLVSFVLAALLSILGWGFRRGSPECVDSTRPSLGLRGALRQGAPLLQSGLLLMSLQWIDTIILGSYADSRSVGIYGAAVNLSLLMSFLLYAVNAILAPRFARAFEAGESARVEREARAATRALVLIGLPVAILSAVFARPMLSVFGPDFADGGTTAFRILVLGHFICLATGPVGYLLMMGKRERAFRNNIALAVVVHLVLLGLLLPPFGILGASAATSAALAVSNLLHLRSCRRELGLATIGPVVSRSS